MHSPPDADHPTRQLAALSLAALSALALLALGCSPAQTDGMLDNTGPPVASFDQDSTQGFTGLFVQFRDTSSGRATTYAWDFGAAGTSSARNPLVQFPAVGSYSVSLTVSGPEGSSRVEKPDLIGVYQPVVADFSCSPLSGFVPVSVMCTDSSRNATSWSWNFGDGSSSSEQSPTHMYATDGPFTITLVATGTGGSSTRSVVADLRAQPVVAAFDCTPRLGFVPVSVKCTDASQNATGWSWKFGDGTSSSEQSPTHSYTTDGPFTVELTASGPGGQSRHSIALNIRSLGASSDVPSGTGSAPVPVTFTSQRQGLPASLHEWKVNGKIVGTQPTLTHLFKKTGTYAIAYATANISPVVFGQVLFDYVVEYGPPQADFHPSVDGSSGPLSVQLLDDSAGEVVKWEWSFGDSETCVYPAAPAGPPDPPPTCNASQPTHTYAAIGLYDVSLKATGPDPGSGGGPVSSTITKQDVVRVYILDPSFEQQAIGGPIAGGWQSLRPDDATQVAEHRALTITQGRDHDMPTQGSKWAALDALGTDGSTPLASIENGVRQDFYHPPGRPVIELDVALLYNEPPASPSSDGVTITVSDGSTSVELPSAWADPSTPYVGQSARFPTRDGNVVRSTFALAASLDLSDHFAAPTDLTRLTLTIRVANGENGLRSPRAYVDNVRFSEPVAALPVDFSQQTVPAVAGRPVTFRDQSCPDPLLGGCQLPSSWRWDFGTHGAVTPPAATGSGAQHPSYVFAAPGSYDVSLVARLAGVEGTMPRTVVVIDAPAAAFEILTPEPRVAPLDLEFADRSTSDPSDPIVAWRWDFGGWGASMLENPAPVLFPQVGQFVVTLEITTLSGLVSSAEMTVNVVVSGG